MEEVYLREGKAKRVRNKVWGIIDSTGNLKSMPIWLFDRNDFDYTLCRFSGAYVFVSGEGDVLYVGQSRDLNSRLRNHLTLENSSSLFLDFVQYIIIIKGGDSVENILIKGLDPVFNIKDGSPRGERFRFYKNHLISKFPEMKEEFLKKLIQERRAEYNIKETNITKYNEGKTAVAKLEKMAI